MEERVPSPFTARERDVLELMAIGLTNKDIADRLGLGARTVETHVAHVLEKLDARTRTSAISEAQRRGLLATRPVSASVYATGRSQHNLPIFTTPVLGRDTDLTHIGHLLERHHLVTLTGAGGVGKTRLAVEVASKLVDLWQNGVWFCDFSAISDSNSVQRAVAWAVGVPERQHRLLNEAIVSSLKPKRVLLIFDNCEHVAKAAGALAEEIVKACPNVGILATSRHSLGIAGEAVHRVPSLALPEVSPGLTAGVAMTSGSVALFVDRARVTQPDFALTDDDAPELGALCRHLNGIPLAIELTAGRVNEFSIETLLENVGEVVLNLRAAGRAAPARHQTMRALLDWSYDLLSPNERTLFRRLAVFVGGFTLDLAAAVSRDAIRRSDLLDVLGALIEKSLVQTTQDRNATRCVLPESTRQFGLEKLRAAGEYWTIAHAHAKAMADLAQRLDETYPTTPDLLHDAQARPEFANWRAALEWAFGERGDPLIGAVIAGSVDRLWFALGGQLESLRWIEGALESLDDSTPVAVRARLELGRAALNVGWQKEESLVQAQRAWKLYESADDDANAAVARSLYALALNRFGRFAEAEAHMQEVLSVARRHNHHRLAGLALNGIANARFERGDIAGARANLREALAEFEIGGHEFGMSLAADNLAEIAFASNEPEEAVRLGQKALAAVRAIENSSRLTESLMNLAVYLTATARFDEACMRAREALALSRESRNEFYATITLQHIAAIAARRPARDGAIVREDHIRAAQLLGYVDANLAKFEYRRDATVQLEYDGLVQALNEVLDPGRFQEFIAKGGSWSEEEAIAEALQV